MLMMIVMTDLHEVSHGEVPVSCRPLRQKHRVVETEKLIS